MNKIQLIRSKVISYLVPIFVFVVVALVTQLQYSMHNDATEKLLHDRAKEDLDELTEMIQDDLRERILVLNHLKREWELKPSAMTEQVWLRESSHIIDQFPGFQAIEWVDKDAVVRWVTPIKGNEAAVGLKLSEEVRRQQALSLARETGKHCLTHVVDLVQGGKGFLCLLPIAIKEETYSELNGGVVLGVFHVERWINELVPRQINERLTYQIHSEDELIYSSEFAADISVDHVFKTVLELDENLKLNFIATHTQTHHNEVGDLILTLGMLIGVICMVTAYFGIHSLQQYLDLKETRRAYERDKIYPILSQTMSAILWHCDPDGRFVEKQEAWETYTGQTWEQYKDFGWKNAISPEYRDELMKLWQESVESKSHFYSHAKAWSKLHQGYRYFAIHVEPLLDEQGNLIEWVGMYLDIQDFHDTEQKLQKSEREVSEANKMLHTVIDTLPVRVYWKDRERNYLGCNRAYVQDAGMQTHADLIGFRDNELPWANRMARFDEDDEKVMRSGLARRSFEEPMRQDDGTITWLSVSKVPIKDENDKVIGLLGIYEDITERINNELELERTRQRFQLAIRGGKIGTWEWDLQSKACLYNDMLFEMLGREPVEEPVPFEDIQQMVHPDDFEISTLNAMKCIQGEVPLYRQEQRYQKADGSWCWLLAVGEVTQRSEDGTPIKLSGIHANIDDLKNAEAALNNLNDRFESAIEAAGDGIFDWNIKTGEVFYFESWYTMFGYESGSFPNNYETWQSLVHPDDLAMAEAAVENHVRGYAERYQAVYRMKCADGSWCWIRATGVITERDTDGSPLRIAGVQSNIDMLKKVEAEVNTLNDRFESAIEAAGDGVFDWNVKTGEVFYFESWYTMFGYESGSLPNNYETWQSLIHPDDLAMAQAAVDDHLGGRKPKYQAVYRMKCADGSWCWIRSTGVITERDMDGSPLRIAGVQSNIDMLKKVEAEVSTLNERFEMAIEAAEYGLFDWNVKTGEVHNFDSWYTMLGYEEGRFSLTYQSWHDLVHPDDISIAEDAIKAHLAGEARKYVATYRMKHKDGYWCWIRAMGVTVEWDMDGSPLRVTGVQSNIQDIKKTEISLNQAVEFLQQKQAEMEQFVYAISHDLKSPMVSCMGFLKYMKEDLANGKQDSAEYAMDRVEKNLEQMGDCIDDMLELSRIGRVKNNAEDVPVQALVQEILDNMTTLIIEKKVKVAMPDEMPVLHADKLRLRQLFQNLIGNALKYGCDREKTSNLVEVLLKQDDQFLRIGIKDEGEGVDEKYQIKIFEMFQRLNKQEEGTGVGLTIVKRIMEMLQGSVTIESSTGQGACFWLNFPVDLMVNNETNM